jgi:hypothetical protein
MELSKGMEGPPRGTQLSTASDESVVHLELERSVVLDASARLISVSATRGIG